MKRGRVLALTETLRRNEYDVLHIQTPFLAHGLGLKLARRLNIPTVETYHTFFEEYLFHYFPYLPKSVMRALARGFSRRQCNQVDGIITPSSAMLDVLRDYGVTTAGAILPTGLESAQFREGDGQAFRQRLGIAPGRAVLTHVGRIAHEKNIDFLLRVVRRVKETIPELAFIIAGDGPALGHIKQLGTRLGLEDTIHYAGYLDRERELLDCYRAGDVFIFASRTETQGLVLLESLASGVPAVSTAVMGTRDIVLPGRGCVAVPEDEAVFAEKLAAVLGDETLRHRLAREARGFAREWDADTQARRLLDFYGEMIDQRAHADTGRLPRRVKMR